METFLTVVRSIGLLLARIAFGVVMVMHGWARWSGDAGIAGQIDYLTQAGIPQPVLVAWGTLLLEVVGGVLLMFGAFTPAVALFFLVEHVLVLVMFKWRHGLTIETGGFEYSLLLAALSLLFLVYGSGKAGVDALFLRPRGERQPRESRQVNDADPA
ncbi:MAG TPA: DoxX family protein [Propionibacteriaceae bacterium]|nr:DoxX family protein [Propionibacteriaceae bacterium]HQE31194.1 DoxX family protein [Propionibacteriaceae bacterium]